MSHKIQLLVNEPCHENWNEMTAAEQGRFCQSCQTTVTDFSQMSDNEIIKYLAEKGSKVCGRFYTDQLSRNLQPDTGKRNTAPYAMNLLMASVLSAGVAQAQVPGSKDPIAKEARMLEKLNERQTMGKMMATAYKEEQFVNGVVLDAVTMQPIPGASIQVGDGWNGVASDDKGQFQLKFDGGTSSYIVTVSSLGYKSHDYTIKKDTSGLISFYLERQSDVLDTLVVKGIANASHRSMTMGIVAVYHKVTVTEKTQRKVTDLTPEFAKKKEVKMYPNPAAPGSVVDVAISVKQTGGYTMEILDTQGHVLHSQQIQMKDIKQNIQVTTGSHWSKGVYWVRVMSKGGGKVFNGKLVLNA
jgi:CarboxypepD_reg-like domain/Secretion system C-terminal sorting domain